jgi:hypothetical protein
LASEEVLRQPVDSSTELRAQITRRSKEQVLRRSFSPVVAEGGEALPRSFADAM